MMAGRMMRVAGAVELLKNEALNTKVVEERAFLDNLAGQPIGPITEVFRVSSGKTVLWTMNDVLKERDLERIEF
jgi:uncharacterized pyridoxamine 5'-phosphate oxidase family protein